MSAVRKHLREIRDVLAREGFTVKRVDQNKHAKLHLEHASGVKFALVVGVSPSDERRWMLNMLTCARRMLAAAREKTHARKR